MHLFSSLTQNYLGNFDNPSSKNLNNNFPDSTINDNTSYDKYRVYSQSLDDTRYRCKGSRGSKKGDEINTTYITEHKQSFYLFGPDSKYSDLKRYVKVDDEGAQIFGRRIIM